MNLYASVLASYDTAHQILDLVHLPADFTNNSLYGFTGKNQEFNKLSAMVAGSDKFVFVVPEYNGSFPGVLKTFIDGLDYPNAFQGKKAALVGLSSGMQGGLLALSHLTDIFNYLGMHVLAQKLKFAHISSNFDGKELTNPLYRDLLEQQVEQLLAF